MSKLNKDNIEKDLQEIYEKLYSATGPLAKLMVDLLNTANSKIGQSGENVNRINSDFKQLHGKLVTVYKEAVISPEKPVTGPTPTLPSPGRSQSGGGTTPGPS